MSKQDLICPSCGGFGFASKEVYVSDNGRLKCNKCREWNDRGLWLTLAQLRESACSLRTRAEAAERERDEAYAAGQRDFQERVAKRLDDLAMEQKSWHNHCAASVIRMEANAVRSLPIKDSP